MGFFGKIFGGSDDEAQPDDSSADVAEGVSGQSTGNSCSACVSKTGCENCPSKVEAKCGSCTQDKVCDSCKSGDSMAEDNLDT